MISQNMVARVNEKADNTRSWEKYKIIIKTIYQ